MLKGNTVPVLDHGHVRLVDYMGSDERIVEAARVSYHSPSKGAEADKKLLEYLWKNKHTSPFEMCKITFDIKMPIFVARQYIRHRMQNLNEVSARYTELPNEFYIPKSWRQQDPKNKQGSVAGEKWDPFVANVGSCFVGDVTLSEVFRMQCQDAYAMYKKMLDLGVAREMARMILPLNIYTQFYATWDLKNLLHFVTLREDAHAQAEIQDYGRAIKSMLVELFPWTMEAFDKYKFVCYERGTDWAQMPSPLVVSAGS